MTVSPRYDQYKDAWDTNVLVEVKKNCLCINLESIKQELRLLMINDSLIFCCCCW